LQIKQPIFLAIYLCISSCGRNASETDAATMGKNVIGPKTRYLEPTVKDIAVKAIINAIGSLRVTIRVKAIG